MIIGIRRKEWKNMTLFYVIIIRKSPIVAEDSNLACSDGKMLAPPLLPMYLGKGAPLALDGITGPV